MSNLRTIKIRGDSTENWEQANPILEYKEIACEFTGSGTLFKVGNGTDSWNDLAYTSVDGGVEEAPIDGKQYTRKDSTWVEVVVQENAVTSVAGKTGDVLLDKTDVGLSNVDNTSDLNKPISNLTQAALDNKVDKVTGKGLSDENYTSSEKTKLSDIAAEATKNRADSLNADKVHTHTTADVTGLDAALDNKVDKQAGKGLSDTNFTQAEKDKLSSLESSKFVGLFVSESALPSSGSEGDYANVDGGVDSDVYRVIWDSSDNKWVRLQGVSTELTDAQIKQQYESNPDTNAFTDDEKSKLSSIASEATKNRPDSENADKVHTHTMSQVTDLVSALAGKVDKVSGKGLSEENYTSAEKTKLADIASEATKNRADSLNADKDHTHTTAQVSGLDDALAGKASTDDSRFTNSREWTASVVPQAEAEAGTSTTARKWTAQRVRQAVLGWWNTSTFKTKLDGIETGATKNRADTLNADKEHTHTTAQVTGLDSALSGKVDKETGKGLIEPAPTDGKQYARKDDAWVEVEDGVNVVQSAGQSTTDVMSQKATTDAIEKVYYPERALGTHINKNWTPRTVELSDWYSVTWSPELGMFAAVANEGTNRVMTSTNGIDWTPRSVESSNWRDVTWSPELGMFVAVAAAGTRQVMTSTNGTTWTPRSVPSGFWNCATWSPELGMFVAVGQSGTARVMTSTNGTTWTPRTVESSNWQSVAWSPELGMFVAVASYGTNRVMTSTNGIDWTPRSVPSSNWLSVTWSPELGMFVAVANTGTNHVMASTNGIDWTPRSAAIKTWHSVTWSPELGMFVAVAAGGIDQVMTSTDGVTWTVVSSPFSNWRSVTWSPELGVFAAVGSGGTNRVMTADIVTQKAVTDKVKETVTANKTLTADDRGKLLIINTDGITITMPANSNFTIDIAKMDESFTTVVQCAGTDKFREGTSTISVIRDVSITNSGVAGKEWLAMGAYEI